MARNDGSGAVPDPLGLGEFATAPNGRVGFVVGIIDGKLTLSFHHRLGGKDYEALRLAYGQGVVKPGSLWRLTPGPTDTTIWDHAWKRRRAR